MTRYILVRHGQTAFNLERRFRGRSDPELNGTGFVQAEAVARALAREPVRAVYSSPLQRALQTARAVARAHGLPVRVVEELADMSFGRWEGLTTDEVKEKDPELYGRWLTEPDKARPPGGETLEEVLERALIAFGVIESRNGDGSAVIVSHAVVCQALLGHVLGSSPAQFWRMSVSNGGISIIEPRDDTLTVSRINDTCHLGDLDAAGKT